MVYEVGTSMYVTLSAVMLLIDLFNVSRYLSCIFQKILLLTYLMLTMGIVMKITIANIPIY